MASLNGHYVSPASKDGNAPTSPESVRDDALLSSTLDEIVDLFHIEEAFPFAKEEEKDDAPQEPTRPSWWRRVADWFCGRSARPGA